MAVWNIEGIDSTEVIFTAQMPGALSEPEVEAVLQRLVCHHLELDEIVGASLRKNMEGYRSLLERKGRGSPIMVGENPYYIATFEDK